MGAVYGIPFNHNIYIYMDGGFLSHFFGGRIFHEINLPAIGVPPFMETSIVDHLINIPVIFPLNPIKYH